jgi:small-conductance mechanosensitive channel
LSAIQRDFARPAPKKNKRRSTAEKNVRAALRDIGNGFCAVFWAFLARFYINFSLFYLLFYIYKMFFFNFFFFFLISSAHFFYFLIIVIIIIIFFFVVAFSKKMNFVI